MLDMDFYNGSLDPEVAKTEIAKSDKPCVFTYGYEWKNPTAHRLPVEKDWVYKLIDTETWLRITEEKEVIHIQKFDANDMW
jgi:hypothetical protein